jgi:hypothetical protein
MKKIYVLLVVCLSFLASANAQSTYYWIGPSSGVGGNWNDNNNWSFTPGGAPVGVGVFPNSTLDDVVFGQNALVKVNVDNINLRSLTVSNSATAKLFVGAGSGATTMVLYSTSQVNPALNITAGSRLEDSADINVTFSVNLNLNAKGVVAGTWYFAGKVPTVTASNGATFFVPSSGTTRLDVNGTMQFKPGGRPMNAASSQNFLFFNSGSVFWLDRDGSTIPLATWHPNATILITGTTGVVPAINQTTPEIGNLTINCPGLATPLFLDVGFGLPNNLIIKGNLRVLNTNGRLIYFATNGSATINNFNYVVNGNLEVSGNSRVAIASANNSNKVVQFQVDGDLNLSGASFDLQIAPSSSVVANSTTLKVRGNINHTAGLFSSANATSSINNSVDLYVVELNGTGNQNVFSFNGTFDNTNNEITLLVNNAAGVTLTSPLAVGKLSFNSTNKGRINTTTTNVLTINNPGTHGLVVNSPSSTGFVNGPVRRRTNSTSDYLVPTGKSAIYDPVQFRPSSNTLSVYQAEYFATAFADLSSISPVNGVSNQEYWQASVVSGADAALILTLTGALPGAGAGDAVGVVRYNGADWVDFAVGGTVIIPGNSTTGSTRSSVAALNGFYTFGYGVAGSLPIHLLTFDARKQSSSSAQVSWTISTNSNPEQFEILRSADGRNFSAIGTVIATDLKYAYTFADNNLPTGTSYYRLKMVDKQGVVSYSPIVAVMNGAKGVVLTSLIPTIVTNSATLTISSSEKGTMQIMVTDMFGRIVKQQLTAIGTGNQQVSLNLQQLPAGAYQVTAVMNNQRVGTIRFVRQ